MLGFLTMLCYNLISTTEKSNENIKNQIMVFIFKTNGVYKLNQEKGACFSLIPKISEENEKISIFNYRYVKTICSFCNKRINDKNFFVSYSEKVCFFKCQLCCNPDGKLYSFEEVFCQIIKVVDTIDNNSVLNDYIIVVPLKFLKLYAIFNIVFQNSMGGFLNILLDFSYSTDFAGQINSIKTFFANHIITENELRNQKFILDGLYFLYTHNANISLEKKTNSVTEEILEKRKINTFPIFKYLYEKLKYIPHDNAVINKITIRINHIYNNFRRINIINLNIDTCSILTLLLIIEKNKIIDGLAIYQQKNLLVIQWALKQKTMSSNEFILFNDFKNISNTQKKLMVLSFLFLIVILENEQNIKLIIDKNFDINEIYTYLFYRAKVSNIKYNYNVNATDSNDIKEEILYKLKHYFNLFMPYILFIYKQSTEHTQNQNLLINIS